MHDPLTFEARLADAFERYLAPAPVVADARAIAAANAVGARSIPGRGLARTPLMARLILAAALLLGLVVGAAIVGGLFDGWLPVQPLPISSPRPSASAAGGVTNGAIVMVIPAGKTAEFQLIYPDGNGEAFTLPIVGGTESCPTFSPDGRSLAYIGFSAGSGTIGLTPQDLLIARADGTEARTVWEGAFDSQTFHQVVWSADSSAVVANVAEHIGPSGEGALVIAQRGVDGASVFFTNAGEFPGEVSLSPDGREIAWIDTNAGGVGARIMVASTVLEGGHRTIATGGWIRALAWSPDGQSIAYLAATSVDANDADVYVVGLDESLPRPLDSGSPGNESQLAWSPDGRLLAVANDTGYVQLFDTAGTKLRRINTADGQLTWAPDSRSILVAVPESLSSRRADRVDIETGDAKPVSGANGFYAQCPVSWQALQP